MELFSIRIQRTFQLVSTTKKVKCCNSPQKSEQNVNYDYVYFFYRHFYVSTSIFRIIDSNDDTCRLLFMGTLWYQITNNRTYLI